jgi:hypothetical protein
MLIDQKQQQKRQSTPTGMIKQPPRNKTPVQNHHHNNPGPGPGPKPKTPLKKNRVSPPKPPPKQQEPEEEEEEDYDDVRDSMDIVEDELFSQLSEALRIEEMKREKAGKERKDAKSLDARLQQYEKQLLREEAPVRETSFRENMNTSSTSNTRRLSETSDKTQQERDVDLLIEELSALKHHIVSSDIISPKKSFESAESRNRSLISDPLHDNKINGIDRSPDLSKSKILLPNDMDHTRQFLRYKHHYDDYDTDKKNVSFEGIESDRNLSDIERKIARLERNVKEQAKDDDEFRKGLEIKLLRIEEVMQRQGDALESLSHVVNREIQSRVAGENRSQTYYQLLSQQIASQIQLQTKRFQLSVNQLSDVVSKLNERRTK